MLPRLGHAVAIGGWHLVFIFSPERKKPQGLSGGAVVLWCGHISYELQHHYRHNRRAAFALRRIVWIDLRHGTKAAPFVPGKDYRHALIAGTDGPPRYTY